MTADPTINAIGKIEIRVIAISSIELFFFTPHYNHLAKR